MKTGRMPRIAALLALMAAPAVAGPWPRAAGEGHLSFGIEADPGDGSGLYATLYAEAGIGGGRTLGLDLGHSDDDLDKAVLFLRRPLGDGDGETVQAIEFGIGMVEGEAALRAGLAFGRGIGVFGHPGWIALDTRAALYGNDGTGLVEADLTLGAETARGDKWLVQVQMTAPSDRAPYVRIAPAFAFRAGRGRHLIVGVTAGVLNTGDARLSLGVWQRF